ncbi:SDR family oxidoreductase [Ralstonia holmesii]|nr:MULTISPECIES: SDR family oxidoreductase [Ralstonia]CAJ0696979.1 Dihydroanticapsin 7-dehydrogenase [Ralstonia sp. LMG 32967]
MLFDRQALIGKRYLITGGSSGIGRATAVALAACGASLVVMGRDETRTCETVAMLGTDVPHTPVVVDFQDADTTADAVKEAAVAVGGVDGVFHGAGLELLLPIKMTKRANLDKIFASSVFPAFGIARALSLKGVVREEGGAFVIMSSAAGLRGQSGMTAYSASKAAVDGMMRSLAVELAPRGIRVNSIAAGAVETAMHGRLASTLPPAAMEAYEAKHLLGFGHADDVASAAVFLLSPAARWITGTTMVVDGGFTVR